MANRVQTLGRAAPSQPSAGGRCGEIPHSIACRGCDGAQRVEAATWGFGRCLGKPVRLSAEAMRDIRIRHGKQTGCGPFAIITVDFEPLTSFSVRLVVPNDVELGYQGYIEHQDLLGYLDAIAAGCFERN